MFDDRSIVKVSLTPSEVVSEDDEDEEEDQDIDPMDDMNQEIHVFQTLLDKLSEQQTPLLPQLYGFDRVSNVYYTTDDMRSYMALEYIESNIEGEKPNSAVDLLSFADDRNIKNKDRRMAVIEQMMVCHRFFFYLLS